MGKIIKIGTRESELAVWQATLVQSLLKKKNIVSELVYIKSEGDVDTITPLYALGVTGVFTKTLDMALLNDRIDIAVHSMKDVPVQLAQGIKQAAILERGSHKDILVLHPRLSERKTRFVMERIPARPGEPEDVVVATSSIRRIAQWLNKYPNDKIVNLRGNVNTRLRKLQESNWHGAIFAAAGLERIHLRPGNAIDLDWMLPAPAQGAIMVVCRENDEYALEACQSFNHEETALCTKIEREFLSALMGGCSTPISALAKVENGNVIFDGNITSPDGKTLISAGVTFPLADSSKTALTAAENILSRGGKSIIDKLQNENH